MIGYDALIENLKMALRALRSNKLRSALTMLGIIIGVSAVITLLSVGRGVEKYIADAFGSIGTNLLFVLPGSPEETTGNGPTQIVQGNTVLGPALTERDAEALRDAQRAPDVKLIAPEKQSVAVLSRAGNSRRTVVSGVTPEYSEVRAWPVSAGSFLSEADVTANTRVAVLGQTVAEALFPDGSDPLQQIVKINQVPYRVIGILQKKGGSLFGDVDDQVLIPLSAAQADLPSFRTRAGLPVVTFIYAQLEDDSRREAATRQMVDILRAQHRIDYRDEDDFSVYSQADFLAAFGAITGVVTLFLSAIAGISLLVGGIGIMNIMLVTVTERTREIGLRKAIGAKRRDILAQFLIEAVTLSLSGGLIGIALGLTGALIVSQLLEGFSAVVSPGAIALAVGFSAVVGLFFGLYPALRASRLHPIEALRFE
ncbi:MAG TPA: ABC transporter permease [Anaerolineae bacterium]|nr:ABC transporter permease [Anaerolineae bacterium]